MMVAYLGQHDLEIDADREKCLVVAVRSFGSAFCLV